MEQTDDDIREIRSSLFSLIRFYVGNNITKEELLALLSFMHTIDDYRVVRGLKRLRHMIISSADSSWLLTVFTGSRGAEHGSNAAGSP